MRLALTLAVAGALAATACTKTSSSPITSSPPAASPRPTTPPIPSTCTAAPGIYRKQVDGRQVVVALPAAATSTHPKRPVVVALHGYQGDAADFATYSGLATRAPASGAVALFPQGVGSPPGWNYPRSNQLPANDVAFLDSMLDQLRAVLCLDVGRLVMTGWSDGADMAVTFGCWGQHGLKGLVAVSAGSGPRQDHLEHGFCPTQSVVYVHGTADPIEPYNGGGVDGRPGYGGARSVSPHDATRQWATNLRCTAFSHHSSPPSTSAERTGSCVGSGFVELVTIEGGGHGWPSSTYDISASAYGPTNHTFDTDAAILSLL